MSRDENFQKIPIGELTVQIDSSNGKKNRRGLQTEIWYPAPDEFIDYPTTKYSEYLGLSIAGKMH